MGKDEVLPWKPRTPGYPSGSWKQFDSETAKKVRLEQIERGRERKRLLRERYEEKLVNALDVIGDLQRYVLDIANDPESAPTKAEMEKLKLGLSAAQQVLDQVLGKPVARTEVNVTTDVVEQMADAVVEWVIEDEQ